MGSATKFQPRHVLRCARRSLPVRAARALGHAIRTGRDLRPLARTPLAGLALILAAIRLRARAYLRPGARRWIRLELVSHGREFTMVAADYGDLGAIREVLAREEYELGPGTQPRLILDLGAHIGAAVVYFKLRYPDALVHAVEPNPETIARLRMNVAQFAGVTVQQAAVSRVAGTATLHLGSGSLDASLTGSDPPTRRLAVTTVTVDGVLEELGWPHVDVLKLDVEGAETEALEGCTALGTTSAVIGEVHPAKTDQRRFFALLSGFSVVTRTRRATGTTFFATREATTRPAASGAEPEDPVRHVRGPHRSEPPASPLGRRAVPMIRRAAGAQMKQGLKITAWQDSIENPA